MDNMTVGELKELLSEYPDYMEVAIIDEAGYRCSIDFVGESYGTLQIRHY